MDTHKNSADEFNRYIEQTKQIRELSAPRVSNLSDENDYRKCLLENFAAIGELAEDNNRILARHCFPLLLSDEPLDQDTIAIWSDFCRKLFDAATISHADGVLLYRLGKRMLREAERTDDNALRMRALNFIIASTYHLTYMRFRSAPVLGYREEGWAAVMTMTGFLEKDCFDGLHDNAKYYLAREAAFNLRLFLGCIYDDREKEAGRSSLILSRMREVLRLVSDPLFQEKIPLKINWEKNRMWTLEYIASLTDDNNAAGFDEPGLEEIYRCAAEMKEAFRFIEPDSPAIEAIVKELPLHFKRNEYLTGRCDIHDYKGVLREIFDSFEDFDFSQDMPTVVMNDIREYLLLVRENGMDEADKAFLARVYARLIDYVHLAPKDNLFGYLLVDASSTLTLFVDVPGAISFEDMCQSIIASFHPSTYIHGLSVAALARCLAHHLIRKDPALFLGVLGLADVDGIRANAGRIEDFVYHAALCHDFGKLLVAEPIMNYGRDLMEEERELIQFHPQAGAALLAKHAFTAPYVDVALGHHKWYNNGGGYPEAFDMEASPIKNVIAVVACADCLDAATDSVGRSYKKSQSLDSFLEELRAGSGSRYAPWLYPLFEDPGVYSEIQELMDSGRDENYRRTYRILRKLNEG